MQTLPPFINKSILVMSNTAQPAENGARLFKDDGMLSSLKIQVPKFLFNTCHFAAS